MMMNLPYFIILRFSACGNAYRNVYKFNLTCPCKSFFIRILTFRYYSSLFKVSNQNRTGLELELFDPFTTLCLVKKSLMLSYCFW